jgi:hypothetical protein
MRAGSGFAYIPRHGLSDILDDELDDFSDDGGALDVSDDLTGTVGNPDSTDLLNSLDTYNSATGQDDLPSGAAVSSGLLSTGAGIFSSIASLFGGGSSAAVNATGISGDEETTMLPTLLLVAAGAGVLYLVFRDRS